MRRHNTDADFSLYARMIPALSFVPIEELENALEVMSKNLSNQLTPFKPETWSLCKNFKYRRTH